MDVEKLGPDRVAFGLHTLTVLRELLEDDVLSALLALEEAQGVDEQQQTSLYCAFVARLYRQGGNLGDHLLRQVLRSENAVVRMRAAGEHEPAEMTASLMRELSLLGRLSATEPQVVALLAGGGEDLPAFGNTAHNFAAVYDERLKEICTRGYGIFADCHMFSLDKDGNLLTVRNPDPQSLADLTGYEREREKIILNTRALLGGLPANNILLYGDAGTGKSSTVKALANAYKGEGLRLVELRKNQLYLIPGLMDKLADNPLKFILFIDDLSFPADDGDFTALKAILEGNISARPQNIVVYATSNRRHMMAERFADRMGDDIHRGDTIEEQTSLSARFGITITFLKPDRELYASIVKALGKEYGVAMDEEELVSKAEAHAIRYGGRSPRTAKQFIELTKARQTLDGQPDEEA